MSEVDISRSRIERLKNMGCADYIHMAMLDRIEALEARVAAAYAYSAAVTGETALLGQVSADAEAHMDELLNKAYEEGRAKMSDDLRNRVKQAIQAVEIPEGGWPEDRPGVWLMALDEAVKAADAALAAERDALRAALEKTRAALEQIESHRRLCMRYDEENGHVPRTLDEEDLRIMEIAARTALNEIARAV